MAYENDNPWGESGTGADPPASDDALAELAEAESAARATWKPHGPALDADRRLADPVACRGCGYNLMGLPADGSCPECGSAVEWSVRGDRLGYCDPRWLASLRSGMVWFICAVCAQVLMSIIGAAVLVLAFTVAAVSSGSGTPASVFPLEIWAALPVVLGLVLSAVYIVGVWKLTVPEPGAADEPAFPLRLVLRWSWITWAVFATVSNVLVIAEPLLARVPRIVSGLAMLVGFFALFVCLRRLALRVPDRGLAGQTRTVMWGVVVCYGVIILSGALMAWLVASGSRHSTPTGTPLGGVSSLGVVAICGSVVGLLVFGVWGLILATIYRSTFARAGQHARHIRARVREVEGLV